MKLFANVAIVALTFSSVAQGRTVPMPEPTARDLYIACYLFVHESDVPKGKDGNPQRFSPGWCQIVAMRALNFREGKRLEHNGYEFCLPKTSEMATDPARAMAFAFMDHYESVVNGLKEANGTTAYAVAMIEKWPCP